MERKWIKVILIVLMAIVLAGVLVACDKGPQYEPPDELVGKDDPATVDFSEGKPVYLRFSYLTQSSSVFSNVYVDEFDVSEIVVKVAYQFAGNKIVLDEGRPLTLDMLTEDSRALIGQSGHHMIFAQMNVADTAVSGSFGLHLMDRSTTEWVDLTFVLGGDDVRAGFGTITGSGASRQASISVVKGREFTWSSFISTYNVSRPGYALGGWIADGQTYDADSASIVIGGATTFTPVWKENYLTVTFDLNLPAGLDPDAQRPQTPEPVRTEKGVGLVARPSVSALDVLPGYTFGGWFDSRGNLWNFATKVGHSDFKLTARWEAETYSVTLNLLGGEFRGGLADAAQTKFTAGASVSYDFDSTSASYLKPFKIVFNRLSYKTKLSDYSAAIKPAYGAAESVRINAASLTDLIIKGNDYYTIGGWYSDNSFQNKFDGYGEDLLVTENLTLYAFWTLNELDEARKNEYFSNYLYDYTVKADGTVRLDKVKDASVGTLVVPATIKEGEITYEVTEIGESAAMNLKSLLTLDLREAVNLTSIADKAFAFCPELRAVELPAPENNKISYVGANAFRGSEWLQSYSSENDGAEYLVLGKVLVKYLGEDKERLGVPDGAEVIAPGAFDSLAAFTTFALSDNVVAISSGAFVSCPALTTVEVGAQSRLRDVAPDAFKGTPFANGAGRSESDHILLGHVYYSFIGGSGKTSAVIPKGVTMIAAGAFANARGITDISFADNSDQDIVFIGADALKDTMWVNATSKNYGDTDTYIRDGFVVVNGILVNYTGRSDIVTLPADVGTIASKAFNGFGVAEMTNLLIPMENALRVIEPQAFVGAYNLSAVTFLANTASTPSVDLKPGAFENTDGVYANADFKVFFYDAAKVAITALDKEWTTLENANRIGAINTRQIRINSDVVPNVYVAGVDGVDYYGEWTRAGLTVERSETPDTTAPDNVLITYTIADGLYVLRSDGIERTEALKITNKILKDYTAAGSGSTAKAYSLVFQSADFQMEITPYPINVYSEIDVSTIDIEGIAKGGEGEQLEGVLLMYTSQPTIVYDGTSLTFTHVNGARGEIALSNPRVKITGYRPTTGTRELTVAYNFAGIREYSKAFNYNVSQPKEIDVRQVDTLIVPLNAVARNYFNNVALRVTRNDGYASTVRMTNASVSVVEVDGQAGDTLDTSTLGFHTARVSYELARGGFIYCDFVYSVILTTDASLFEIEVLTADSAAKTGTAAIKAVRRSVTIDTIAIPSVIVKNGITYDIVAIGESAFASHPSLESVYIPMTVTRIEKNAFEGCAQLRNVYSFSVETTQTDFTLDHVTIISENRVSEATIGIMGLVDTTHGSVITVPERVTLTDSLVLDGNGYTDCTVRVTYNCTITLDDSINPFAGYKGVVRLPDSAAFDAFANKYATGQSYKIQRYKPDIAVIDFDETFIYSEPKVTATSRTGEVSIKTASNLVGKDGVAVIPTVLKGASGTDSYSFRVTSMEAGALSAAAANGISKIYVPTAITSLKYDVSEEPGLEIIVYDASLPYILAPVYSFSAAVQFIGAHAFGNCVSLSDAGLNLSTATSLSRVGVNAFGGCTALTTVDLSQTLLAEINSNLFKDCTGLVSVVVPESLRQIGAGAFYECINLSSITKAGGAKINNVVYIGQNAFYGCVFNKEDMFDIDFANPDLVDPEAFANCEKKSEA